MKFCVICMDNTPHVWNGETWVCQVCEHRFSDSLSREEYVRRLHGRRVGEAEEK